MAYPVSQYGASFRDYDRELASFQVWSTTLTAGNFAAQATAAAALQAAIEDMVLGEPAAHRTLAANVITSGASASSTTAQRELKWLIRYHDTSGRKYSVELPTANPALLATNSEFYDQTLPSWTDFVTAFEAFVVSPGDSSAVTVDSAQLVGRRT